jgi:hypothetical protein
MKNYHWSKINEIAALGSVISYAQIHYLSSTILIKEK